MDNIFYQIKDLVNLTNLLCSLWTNGCKAMVIYHMNKQKFCCLFPFLLIVTGNYGPLTMKMQIGYFYLLLHIIISPS